MQAQQLKAKNNTCSKKCRGKLYSRENNPNWRGGRFVNKQNYIEIKPLETKYGVDARGYILEHRYVMGKHLNRPLKRWEIVHHKDGNRQNNSLNNLEIVNNTHNSDVENQLKLEIRRLKCLLKKHGISY